MSKSTRRGRFTKRRLGLAERYYERGLFQFQKNKLDLALADLDAAIEEDPKNGELYVARGLMLLEDGSPDEAEEDFAHGLSLDPTQWLAHYGRGMSAFKKTLYTDTINHFSRAQQLAPDRAEIYFYRAVAFHQLGNMDDAIQDMNLALKLFQDKDADRKQIRQAEQWLKIFKNDPIPPERPQETDGV